MNVEGGKVAQKTQNIVYVVCVWPMLSFLRNLLLYISLPKPDQSCKSKCLPQANIVVGGTFPHKLLIKAPQGVIGGSTPKVNRGPHATWIYESWIFRKVIK